MSKIEEMAKAYRDYREKCGIKDPVMLDEIEEAYYEGANAVLEKALGWVKKRCTDRGYNDFKKYMEESV